MVDRLETAQDIRRAFGMSPPTPNTGPSVTAGSDEPRRAGSVPSEHAFALSRSYEVRGVQFSTIALRPPRGHEFWEIGDPHDWQFPGGRPLRVDNLVAMRAYAERCSSIPGEASVTGAAIVEALDLRDTLSLRKAVMGFFKAPEEEASA